MPDQYTEVTTRSWGSRLGGSFGAVLASLLLFIGSFVLLYWNEGRPDMSNVAKTAVEAPADHVDPALEGKLISVTGQVKTTDMIGDGLFLAPGNYLGVMRSVEMYAWQEKTSSTSDTKVGGSEETKTTYSYEKRWTASPSQSSSFKVPEGHTNPQLPYESTRVNASQATIGAYSIDPDSIGLPGFSALNLTQDMLPGITAQPAAGTGTLLGSGTTMSGSVMTGTTMAETPINTGPRLADNAVYIGKGSTTAPQIGDVRITYTALRPDLRATVFGRQAGSTIEPFVNNDGRLYSMFAGNRDEAIKSMHDAYSMMTWVLRFVGFFMMWGGLAGIFAPLNVLLDVLPFLGSISRGAISFIAFWISLALTIVTIILSMLLHNIWIILLCAVLGIIGTVLWIKSRGKKVAA